MNKFSRTKSTDQKLRHVTYIAEMDFLKKHLLTWEFDQNVHDFGHTYIFYDELGAI